MNCTDRCMDFKFGAKKGYHLTKYMNLVSQNIICPVILLTNKSSPHGFPRTGKSIWPMNFKRKKYALCNFLVLKMSRMSVNALNDKKTAAIETAAADLIKYYI